MAVKTRCPIWKTSGRKSAWALKPYISCLFIATRVKDSKYWYQTGNILGTDNRETFSQGHFTAWTYSGLLISAYRNFKKTERTSPISKSFSIFQVLMWPHSMQAAHHVWGGAVLKHGWVDRNFECLGHLPDLCTLHQQAWGSHQLKSYPPAWADLLHGLRRSKWSEKPTLRFLNSLEVSQSLKYFPRQYTLCRVRQLVTPAYQWRQTGTSEGGGEQELTAAPWRSPSLTRSNAGALNTKTKH